MPLTAVGVWTEDVLPMPSTAVRVWTDKVLPVPSTAVGCEKAGIVT